MNANSSPTSALDPVDRACRVDSICDAFEAAWRKGGAPRIEDYLGGTDASARRELLDALFAVEFSYRVHQGETPRVEDYHDRFPADLERFAQIACDVAKDRTVLMVEHNMSVVADLSDTITVLARGEVLAEGPYATVSKNPAVVEAYVGTGHG